MIEFLGLMYGIAKDVKDWLKWDEQTKQIDRDWLNRSGFENHMIASGIRLYWSKPDSVATRELDGWSVVCELDQSKRIRYRLVRYDGTVLLGKPA